MKPSNWKNPEEPKNDKFVSKTYTFDVTKCDEIFDLLVKEGIMIVPNGLKLPPLEQRQKRGYCKFHCNFGHQASRCVVFKDSVQKALNEGRLIFGDKLKQPMQVDDPLVRSDSMYLEVAGLNMVEISEIDPIAATDGPKVDVEMVTGGHRCANTVITEDQYEEKIQVVFPKAKENLIDFLNRFKISSSPVMLCLRCSAIFDKKAAKNVKGFQPKTKRKGKWADKRPNFSFDKSNIPFKDTSPIANQKKGPVETFTPPSKSPNNQWIFSEGKKPNHKSLTEQWVSSGGKRNIGYNNQNEMFDKKQEETSDSKRFLHNVNYKGRNPMTKTQWRRFQRHKKNDAFKDVSNIEKNVDRGKSQEPTFFDAFRKLATERIFPPLSVVKKGLSVEDEELTSNFTDSEASLNIILVVSMLPFEYDVIS